MIEPAVDSEVSQVEKGYRTRKISLEPFLVGLDLVVNFDNFALMIKGSKYSMSMKVVSGQCDPPFYLNQYCTPWKVEATVVIRLADDETEVLDEFNLTLSNKEPSSVDQSLRNASGKLVVMDLEFTKLEGLSVEPLRNYAAPNDFADVTIIVEGQKFELNKVFLATHSSYFKTLLFGHFVERNQKEVELRDVSAEAFTDLLDLLTLSMHQLHRKAAVFAVLRLADQLDVPLIFKRIENMLLTYPKLRALNIAEKLWAADKFGMKMVSMHVISTWTDDAKKYLTVDLWNDLNPATTLQLFNTLEDRRQCSGHVIPQSKVIYRYNN